MSTIEDIAEKAAGSVPEPVAATVDADVPGATRAAVQASQRGRDHVPQRVLHTADGVESHQRPACGKVRVTRLLPGEDRAPPAGSTRGREEPESGEAC